MDQVLVTLEAEIFQVFIFQGKLGLTSKIKQVFFRALQRGSVLMFTCSLNYVCMNLLTYFLLQLKDYVIPVLEYSPEEMAKV